MKIAFNLLAWSFVVGSVSGQCSLCPGGASDITNVNAQIHAIAPTCGEIEADISESSTGCQDLVDIANTEFDLTGFCCSQGTSLANIECTICEDGADFDPDLKPSAEVNPNGLTCGDAKAIADFTVGADSQTCQSLRSVANEGCCGDNGDGCSVCPAGSTMANANNLIPGQALTCSDFDLALADATDPAMCASTKAPFSDYNLEAYCGCTGVASGQGCDFCTKGLIDPTNTVDGTGGQTCASFEGLAEFIKSPGACTDWQKCCTPTSTEKPVVQNSAASGVSFLVATVVGVLALVAQA